MTNEKNYQDFSLSEWTEYIQYQHKRTMDLTLERVARVWRDLGSPQGQFNIVVAGTNGKGSSISMLDSVFTHIGKTTGVYTSPHLIRYNERVKINGCEVSDQDLCEAFTQVERARKSISLTYFEYGTLCALWIFAQRNVEVALLEVGLGGRLDAVNIVDNDIALITSIGLDHELWLGSDTESIGREKAGVIKENGYAVFAAKEMPQSIAETAQNRHANLLVHGKDYTTTVENETLSFQSNHALVAPSYQTVNQLPLVLGKGYQAENLAGVVALLSLVAEKFSLSSEQVIAGLGKTKINGRCQIIDRDPLVIVDVAHNANAMQQLLDFLQQTPCVGKRLAVFGALADKSLQQMVAPMTNLFDHWFLVGLEGERGQTCQQLADQVCHDIEWQQMTQCTTPITGYAAAKQVATRQDQIVIFGSFYNAGAIMASVNNTST